MKLRKQFYKILAGERYVVVINQLVVNKENYEIRVREYDADGNIVNETVKFEASPFFDKAKKSKNASLYKNQ